MKCKARGVRFDCSTDEKLIKLADSTQSTPSKIIEEVMSLYLDIGVNAKKRGDLLIQKEAVSFLYNSVTGTRRKMLIELEIQLSTSCIYSSVSKIVFDEVIEDIIKWLTYWGTDTKYFEDSGRFVCNHHMGYGWSEVKCNVISEIYRSIDCKVTDMIFNENLFEFTIS